MNTITELVRIVQARNARFCARCSGSLDGTTCDMCRECVEAELDERAPILPRAVVYFNSLPGTHPVTIWSGNHLVPVGLDADGERRLRQYCQRWADRAGLGIGAQEGYEFSGCSPSGRVLTETGCE